MIQIFTSLRGLLPYSSLSRLMTGAALGLSVLMVIAVAESPRRDTAFAQSVESNSQSSQQDRTADNTTSETGSHKVSGTANASSAPTLTSGTTNRPAVSSPSMTSVAPKAPLAAAPAPAVSGYPLHTNIKTTYFWAGEAASADNDFIQNVSSAWQTNWQNYFGGSDDPVSRCGYNPCAFTPRENPFYFALPFGDYTTTGPVSDLSMVHWYNPAQPMQPGQSILKNRWIMIQASPNGASKTVYAQWQDVGPFSEHDASYVFGTSAPASTRAGLDVSPAVRDYLGMGGSTTSSWKFVDAADVPPGPWKTTITSSGPDWF